MLDMPDNENQNTLNDTSDHTKPPQILMAFDFGMKRIGTAIGQTVTQSAKPLENIPARDGIPDWEKLDKLIKVWEPSVFIVGLPLNMDGSEQEITLAVKRFGKRLSARYQLPTHFNDERMSSLEAREHLFADGGYRALQNNDIDSVAAKLILESWMRNKS